MQSDKPEQPAYPFPPIGSRKALARILQCSIEDLTRIEESADRRYRVKKEPKKDGTTRICYDASPTFAFLKDERAWLVARLR